MPAGPIFAPWPPSPCAISPSPSTAAPPSSTADVVVYRIYQTAWEFLRFGYASAMAVVLFLLLLLATILQFRLLGRRAEVA